MSQSSIIATPASACGIPSHRLLIPFTARCRRITVSDGPAWTMIKQAHCARAAMLDVMVPPAAPPAFVFESATLNVNVAHGCVTLHGLPQHNDVRGLKRRSGNGQLRSQLRAGRKWKAGCTLQWHDYAGK